MSDSTVPESSYPSLRRPEFKSAIPEHLLQDATPAEKYLLEQINVLSQTADWSIDAHISTMESVRRTNGRLIRAEADIAELKESKKSVITGWKVVAAIVGGGMGFLSFLALVVQLFSPK